MNRYLEELPYIRIPLRGKHGKGKYTLVDGDYDGEYFSQFKWYVSPAGYVIRTDYANVRGRVSRTGKPKNRSYIYLHREVARTPKRLVTDHINRNKLDNRSRNLRWTDWAGNANNRDNTRIKRVAVYSHNHEYA